MNAQSPRQHQQVKPAELSQSVDKLSYTGSLHGTSNNRYDAEQESTRNGGDNSCGTTKDNDCGAAQDFHDADNTGYAATTTAPSQPGFTATNAPTAHSLERPPHIQVEPLYTSHTAHDQAKAHSCSLNTNQTQALISKELSSPAISTDHLSEQALLQYDQQQPQQHTASPTQDQNGHKSLTTVSGNDTMTTAGMSQQYNNHIPLQLPDVDTAQTSQSIAQTPSYTPQSPALIAQPPSSGISEPFKASSTTVDPMASSGPRSEHKQQQAASDAACAEQEKEDEEPHKEKGKAGEGERKRKGEETRQGQIAVSQPEPRAKQDQKQQAPVPAAAQSSTTESSGASAGGSDLEAEIRAMMAKMRELNNKDPQLLARIWEEERRARTPKLPIATAKPAPQPPVVPPSQEPMPPVANQRKKATPRKSPSAPAVKAVMPIQTPALQITTPVPAPTHARSSTGAIWPHEKKLEIAKAAAHYLTVRNPDIPLDAGQILRILNGNPSYVQLCEQLEQMGFKLNRASFARNLLHAVPSVNSASRTTVSQPIAPAQPAVIEPPMTTPAAPYPRYASAAASPMNGSPYPLFPGNDVPPAAAGTALPTNRSPYTSFPGNDVSAAADSPIPVANMIPTKPALKQPTNKEEAARKRSLSELVDLSQLDEDDMGPPMKKLNADRMYALNSPHPHINNAMDKAAVPVGNFPTASIATPQVGKPMPGKRPIPASELRRTAVVEPLDKKKALRRNTYNPATIARDVLLACGRHPYERQLNQHLDVLKVNISQITNESDLSTIKWNIIDPGDPPPGYFKGNL